MLPDQLMESFWFKGPDFLQLPEDKWPESLPVAKEMITEVKTTTLLTTKTEDNFIYTINHRNSFKFMKRTTAFILRFIRNCKSPPEHRKLSTELEVEELRDAEMIIIKQIQLEAFFKEIKQLKEKGIVHASSQLSNLVPFLDIEGIIRVGGRLQKSKLLYENKHQAVLPYPHPLTKLLMTDLHDKHLHAGPQALLAITRQRFWPLNGKRIAKAILHQCVRCAKTKPQIISQLMGNLPPERVQPTRPFVNVGVDFCGPIYIHYKIRGKKPTKAYVAVFICFAVKAVHLEVVSDLTTTAFIGALKRFIARRGRPAKIFSDNATNFVGARAELEDVHELFMNQQHQDEIKRCCANEGIQWCHIPPRSPHFGGIWEAAVKSAKHHLRRVIQGTSLTYEELCTVMADIEAVLNSRPLTPLSSDPNDPQALTPGHFLIGAPLTSIIEPSIPVNQETNLMHWNRVKAVQHEFWRRWSSEYLQEMQNRYKWKRPLKDIEEGTVVVLKEDNLPPLKWRMGIVIGTRKGSDGLSRVADIKTSSGVCQRSIHRICPLPVKTEEDITSNPIKNTMDTSKGLPKNKSTCKRPAHPLKGRFLPISRPPSEDKPDHQPKRAKTARVTLPKAMLTLLLLTVIPNLAKGNNSSNSASYMEPTAMRKNKDYTIIYPKPGLYVEQAGLARIRRGTFRIELTFQGSYISRDEDGVNKIIEQMTKICKTTKEMSQETHCETIIHHLRERQAEILRSIRIINNFQSSRAKRGILGKILQTVFGVNDEVYEDIESLNQNQQQLLQAANRQNALLLTTQATMEENEAQLARRLDHFAERLNKGIEAINNMQAWYKQIDANKLSIHILAAHQTAENYLDEIEERYSKLLAALFNRGNIFDFLTISQVAETIRNSSQKLPPNIEILQFPQNRLEFKHHDQDLKIFGFFDIAEISNYTLIKVTPIPHRVKDNLYAALDLPSSALAIDYNNQLYFELTDEEFQQCTTVDKFKFLCSTTVVRTIENHPNCIIDAIYQRQEGIKCSTHRFEISHILWKHLYMANTWLFVAETSTPAALHCEGIRQDITLQGIGIIKIRQECAIRTKGNILKSELINNFPIHSTFSHPVNITIHETNENKTSLASTKLEPVLRTSEQFSKIQKIPDLRPTNFKWKTIGHHAASSAITITIIATISIIIFTMKRRFKGCNASTRNYSVPRRQAGPIGNTPIINYPVPAPRKHINPAFELKEFKAGEDVKS